MHFPKNLFREGFLAGLSSSSSFRPREGPRDREGSGDVQDIRPDLCSGSFDTFDDSLC